MHNFISVSKQNKTGRFFLGINKCHGFAVGAVLSTIQWIIMKQNRYNEKYCVSVRKKAMILYTMRTVNCCTPVNRSNDGNIPLAWKLSPEFKIAQGTPAIRNGYKRFCNRNHIEKCFNFISSNL